jgi:hypothetical protein
VGLRRVPLTRLVAEGPSPAPSVSPQLTTGADLRRAPPADRAEAALERCTGGVGSDAILQDGLIDVVDLHNGLHVLKYRGPLEKVVRGIRFLDGNSNQVSALLRAGRASAAIASSVLPTRNRELLQDPDR